ncbi:NB-ARC domain-containing protein [Streptomyces rugosispiralis]|uniref:NB-ARC domain-containing protein n=1 Tax=Streptomyces rugosispiralis TaxID=2967341 RepID=A0ABT1UXD3_9ACTN|nr:NB-ARC domain-containing protein [Streptomyces rugosispiralis]MCQ8189782.1 NB-ARC domain-containing protein [Streptomyces rugosispiralis]
MPLVGRAPGILRDRADLMERLRAAVTGPGGDVHVLHGLGGCGKTAVAHALFTEAVRDHGRVGLWVNASERISLRAGMLAVAGDRGATTGELAAAAGGQRAAADLVSHYLDHSAQRWLLVLDNADDPTVLEEGGWLRTSPLGTVLVTTRHATSPLWRGAGSARYPVGVLPEADAAQVLCDLAAAGTGSGQSRHLVGRHSDHAGTHRTPRAGARNRAPARRGEPQAAGRLAGRSPALISRPAGPPPPAAARSR